MNLTDKFKSLFMGRRADAADSIVHDALNRASERFSAAFDAIDSYTTRANHRYAIWSARNALDKATIGDLHAKEQYDEAVAAYTDPADFVPYTVSSLDA